MERKQQAEVSPERCWTAVRCFLEMDNDEICEQPNTQLGAVTFQRYLEGIVKINEKVGIKDSNEALGKQIICVFRKPR